MLFRAIFAFGFLLCVFPNLAGAQNLCQKKAAELREAILDLDQKLIPKQNQAASRQWRLNDMVGEFYNLRVLLGNARANYEQNRTSLLNIRTELQAIAQRIDWLFTMPPLPTVSWEINRLQNRQNFLLGVELQLIDNMSNIRSQANAPLARAQWLDKEIREENQELAILFQQLAVDSRRMATLQNDLHHMRSIKGQEACTAQELFEATNQVNEQNDKLEKLHALQAKASEAAQQSEQLGSDLESLLDSLNDDA